MKYIQITQPGPPEVLSLAEGPTPVPGPGEVVIRVAAAGVNRADLMQRAGKYPPPPGASPILGMEVAGTIAAAAPDSGWHEGDRVCALVTGGGYADYCVAPGPQCLPVPKGLSMRRGGGHPRSLLHRLGQRLPNRTPHGRRAFPGAWRHQRHRHHRDPARPRVRRHRLHHGGQRREVPRLRLTRSRTGHQLQRARFRQGVPRHRPDPRYRGCGLHAAQSGGARARADAWYRSPYSRASKPP